MQSNDPADSSQKKTDDQAKALRRMINSISEIHSSEQSFLEGLKKNIILINKHRDLFNKFLSKEDLNVLNSVTALIQACSVTPNYFIGFPGQDSSADQIADFAIEKFNSSEFLNHAAAIQTLSYKNYEYSKMLRNLRSTLTKKDAPALEANAFDLSELDRLAITPIQRGPRYELLLRDLSSYGAETDINADSLKQLQDSYKAIQKISVITNQRLPVNALIDTLKAMIADEERVSHSDKRRNTTLNTLESTLKNIAKTIKADGSVDTEAFNNISARFWADAYIDHRSKDVLGHTAKTPFLRKLEGGMVDVIGGNSSGKKNIDVIFDYFNKKLDKKTEFLATHLFNRAMSEGVGLGKRQIFINAIKAVERMGEGSSAFKSQWNKLADELKVPFVDAIKLPEKDLAESQIDAMYTALQDSKIVEVIKEKFPAEVLISYLKNNRPNDLDSKDIRELNTLIERLETIKDKPVEMHNELMTIYSAEYEREKNRTKGDAVNNPFLAHLENALQVSGISKKLDPNQPNKDLSQIATAVYLDAYLDGRTKGTLIAKTFKTDFLKGLEKSIIAAFNLPLAEGQHPQDVILKHAGSTPEALNTLVNRLFRRAMSEGIANQEPTTYVNAVKLVINMGNDAINYWNRLTKGVLKENSSHFVLQNTVYNEKGEKDSYMQEIMIKSGYENAVKNKAVRADVGALFKSQILMNALRKNLSNTDLNSHQRAELDNLILDLRLAPQDKDVQKVFLEFYLKVYINELMKPKQGALLTALDSAAADYSKITKNDFIVGEPIKGKENHIDAKVLAGISRLDDPKAVIKSVFSRAAEDMIQASRAGDDKEQKVFLNSFVNCLKAVVRMKSLDTWQELAKELPALNIKSLMDKSNKSKKEISESDITGLAKELLASPDKITQLKNSSRDTAISRPSITAQNSPSRASVSAAPDSPQSQSEKRFSYSRTLSNIGLMHHDKRPSALTLPSVDENKDNIPTPAKK